MLLYVQVGMFFLDRCEVTPTYTFTPLPSLAMATFFFSQEQGWQWAHINLIFRSWRTSTPPSICSYIHSSLCWCLLILLNICFRMATHRPTQCCNEQCQHPTVWPIPPSNRHCGCDVPPTPIQHLKTLSACINLNLRHPFSTPHVLGLDILLCSHHSHHTDKLSVQDPAYIVPVIDLLKS